MATHRYDFASDNTAGICLQSWAALEQANADAVASYGDDRWTQRVSDLVREIFETNCASFFVFNGTAANSLALAHLCRSYHSVICSEHAHIETDECGGPEFFSGGTKLLPTRSKDGKLDLAEIEATLLRQRDLHSPKPRVISVTQATELGTAYSRDELAALAEFARERSMLLHMDGARFANAVATLGCSPKEITWLAGVDVLTFGGTKNGTGGGEVVVFFKPELAEAFDYRAKQAGQLASKMRFLAAPWAGLLSNGVWLENAQRANASAEKLARALREVAGLEPAFPREANAVFLAMPQTLVHGLYERGWHFYKFIEPDIYRLMCSWAMNDATIDHFIADVKNILSVQP